MNLCVSFSVCDVHMWLSACIFVSIFCICVRVLGFIGIFVFFSPYVGVQTFVCVREIVYVGVCVNFCKTLASMHVCKCKYLWVLLVHMWMCMHAHACVLVLQCIYVSIKRVWFSMFIWFTYIWVCFCVLVCVYVCV